MSDRLVIIVPDSEQLAAHAADYLIEVVSAALHARGRAHVALAGGSTPRAMNTLLARTPRRDRIDWSKVTFYFGDERCVPPDHVDSNYRMTRETLFQPLAIESAAIFRIHGEDEPPAAASAYDELLLKTLGNPPVFDLLNLGMGPDGHTASLFPGTLAGLDDRRSVVANFVPKFDAHRITVTPYVIAAARSVMITAGGAEKAASLRAVLTGPFDIEHYPAQLVRALDGKARWFVDEAAAELLDRAELPSSAH